MQLTLKYGCNPYQQPARAILPDPSPLTILNGTPGYINLMDALGAWQLVRELGLATGKPAAASFKHTSPAGAAVAHPIGAALRQAWFLKQDVVSPVTQAYLRARGGDRMSSFGDTAAVSACVDLNLARVLKREVSDLIVAPDYAPEALELLKTKKKGAFLVLRMDPDYEPPEMEQRTLFGVTLEQKRNNAAITADLFKTKDAATLSQDVLETLVTATIAIKYTQSNSVCVAYDGQVIGMGAGQQSRIHCTRLACTKAEKWLLQLHPKTLALRFRQELSRPEKANIVDWFILGQDLSVQEREQMLAGLETDPEPITVEERAAWFKQFNGICLSSDAYFPFRDNIDRAARSNVRVVVHPGGSVRDEEVARAAEEHGMRMISTGMRWFLH